MNKERLLKLADFLEKKVPPEQFDMTIWWATHKSCGTLGCAMGWACSIPEFNELGLHLETGNGYSDVSLTDPTTGLNAWEGISAAMVLFDIPRGTARDLFMAPHYHNKNPGPKDVAARIREVVAREPD